MAAVVEDVLQTRLDLVGLGTYTSGIEEGAKALGIFDGAVSASSKRLAGISVASGAAALGLGKVLVDAAMASADELTVMSRASGNLKGQMSTQEVSAFTSKLQGLTGVADDSIAGFLGLLGTFSLTGAETQALALPILNASEALKAAGVSADSMSMAVGKALEGGSATNLRRMGIIIDPDAFAAADRAQRLTMLIEALQRQGGDAAIAFRQTLPGALQASASAIGDVQEALGAGLVGPLNAAANAGVALAQAIASVPTPVMTAAGVIGVGLVGALGVVSVSAGIAFARSMKLANGTLVLAEAHLKAAGAAKAQAAAEGELAGSVGKAAIAEEVASSKGGLMGKVGGAFKGKGAGLAAALVADVALSMIPEQEGAAGDLLNVGKRGAMGASLGANFGPWGAAIGAGAGVLGAAYENISKAGQGYSQSPAYAAIKAQVKAEAEADRAKRGGDASLRDVVGAIERNTNATVSAIRQGNTPIDRGVIPGARQVAAARWRALA